MIQNRLTPKILAAQVNEEFLSIDNKFFRTFVALFKKPEDIIDGFINGVRKKYIGVVTYYAISLTVLGFQMFFIKTLFPEFLEAQNNALINNFNINNEDSGNQFSNFPDFFNDYQGVIFSILMPLIAVGTWIVYLDKRKHNYTEHLVINLYTTAQTIYFSFVVYMLLAILKISDFLTVSLIITPLVILYGAFVFKRLYQSSFLSALVRYITAYLIYMVVFGIMIVGAVIVLLIYLIATGKIII